MSALCIKKCSRYNVLVDVMSDWVDRLSNRMILRAVKCVFCIYTTFFTVIIWFDTIAERAISKIHRELLF